MASRTSAVPWRYQKFSALLCSVVLEWILMLLLLLEGLLSYLATTFARLCKLQPPCPVCTRLDHVLGKAQPGFYRDLMCNSHKAEASSWAFCRIHQKLVDGHSMCEACLLSFATDFGLRYDASEEPVMNKDTLGSCCSRPLKLKSCPFVVLRNEASGIGLDDACRGFSRFIQHSDDINYVAYSELKTSDSESEPLQLGGNAESFRKDITSDLKEGIILDHPPINTAKGIPVYGNPQEKVHGHSELVLAQNGGPYCKPSENTGDMCSIQADGEADIQSNDLLPIKHGQQITEDSYERDKSENDVWHSAPGSIAELPAAATTSVETDTMEAEKKSESTYMTSMQSSFKNVHGDLKLLLSQLSNSSLQPDSTDSPSAHDQSEHAILHNISRALSFQRNDSGISENAANEVEVESTVDQLKRRIELDRQSTSRLWKELEEERNASAVAANQTMAMITRLQEEKAAMQMEALQYQRMMEEQSKYDREDLQKMTEVVEALQAEIQSCKVKLRDQLLVDEIRDHMNLSSPEEHEPAAAVSRVTVSLSCFQDEKAYVSKSLMKLKQKLHRFSNNSKHVIPLSKVGDDDDGEDSVNIEDGFEDYVGQGEKNDTIFDNNLRRNGSRFRELAHGEADPEGNKHHATVSESDLASFEDEISEVSRRLLALEADRSFLEHSVNSLRNGREGEELVRDIACSLRELRKVGITWKEYD